MAQQGGTTKGKRVDVILGVLENLPGEYAGEADFRTVRALFEKDGNDWKAFPTKTKSYLDLKSLPRFYPKEMTWTIAFDGRNLGTITAQTQPEFRSYSEIGIGNITSDGPIPTVDKKSRDYAGFGSDRPLYRPLVAISQPNVADPEHWKRAQPSSGQIAAARKQFRTRFPSAFNCKSPEQNIPRPWKYRDDDIRVANTYSSSDGSSLLELKLTGYACDGPGSVGDPDPFEGQWYAIGSSEEPRFLGDGMWLVDAGDYDNSGKSAVLFSIDGYDKGGYRLFYQDFMRSAEFLFSYH